jgi:hypothetical protein
MKDLFRIVFNIEKDASVETLACLMADLQAITQAGHDLAIYRAEAEADKRLALLAREKGWQGILEEARMRQLPAVFSENDQVIFETEPQSPVAAYRAPSPSTRLYLLTQESAYEPWVRLLDQFRSYEVMKLIPSLPYRFRSIRYEGILVIEIISEHGIAALALSELLKVARAYEPKPNSEQAYTEDRAFFRTELRALASRQLSEGAPALTPDITRDLFPENRLDAMRRLSMHEQMMEHSILTEE